MLKSILWSSSTVIPDSQDCWRRQNRYATDHFFPAAERSAPVLSRTGNSSFFSPGKSPEPFRAEFPDTDRQLVFSLWPAPFPRCCSVPAHIPAPAAVFAAVTEAGSKLLTELRFSGEGPDIHPVQCRDVLPAVASAANSDTACPKSLLFPDVALSHSPSRQKTSPPQIICLPLVPFRRNTLHIHAGTCLPRWRRRTGGMTEYRPYFSSGFHRSRCPPVA
ncbi:hypothetical protein BANRA_05262 [Klebsiella pneumoniae]|nr:hypothetical protein BANRA_05262 [Klebsiella pneumoniae]